MLKCPNCQSLVADDQALCPSCRFDLEAYKAEARLSPAATVVLTPEKMKELYEELACPACGELMPPGATACPHCGAPAKPLDSPGQQTPLQETPQPVAKKRPQPPPPVARAAEGGPGPRPRNTAATVSYYLALFSVLPIFPIGLLAVLLGLIGLNRAGEEHNDPGRRQALIGVLGGGFFGVLWTGVTLWLLMQL